MTSDPKEIQSLGFKEGISKVWKWKYDFVIAEKEEVEKLREGMLAEVRKKEQEGWKEAIKVRTG
jgi:hypothetical protein